MPPFDANPSPPIVAAVLAVVAPRSRPLPLLSHTQNERGYICDLQVLDEAAFVSAKFIEELFLPVGFQKHVATLFVTTPGGSDSWFMWAVQMMHPDRPEEPIIPLRTAYRPCDKCAKQAVPAVCMHVANQRAPSKDPERERVLRLLIRDQALFVAESLGLAAAQSGRIFNQDAVFRLQRAAPYRGPLTPFDIIIGIDGAEGGSDQYALTAQCAIDSRRWVILYMDAFRVDMGDVELEHDHVRQCREYLMRRFPVARLVWAVENLPGNHGGTVAHQLAAYRHRCLVLHEYGRDRRPGVPKDREITKAMCAKGRRLLVEDGIAFAADMGCPPGHPGGAAALQAQLCQQLLAFEITPDGKWTGKNGATGRDDLAVTWLMGLYWMSVYAEDELYATFRATA